MTRVAAQRALENRGYKITYYMQGGVQATKGCRTYRAGSINGLYNQILGKEW